MKCALRHALGKLATKLIGVTEVGKIKNMQWRVDRAVMYRFAKPRLSSVGGYKGSTPLLSAKFVMSEFDDEEIVINQYSSQTNGALAEMVYAPD
jgi:hypothetical protein